MASQVEIVMKLPVVLRKEGKWYVSTCPILNVSSQGTSRRKALDNLGEALYLFLRSCFERGTLDQVLKESGFRPARRQRRASSHQQMITVPLPFMVDRQAVDSCPA